MGNKVVSPTTAPAYGMKNIPRAREWGETEEENGGDIRKENWGPDDIILLHMEHKNLTTLYSQFSLPYSVLMLPYMLLFLLKMSVIF